MQSLDFEKPLTELYNKIDELKRLSEKCGPYRRNRKN